MDKHNQYAIFLILLMIVASPLLLHAQIGTPFGGTITAVITCNDGMLLYVLQPLAGIVQLYWPYGQLPYLMYVVPHIGQNVLGEYGPFSRECIVGETSVGNGNQISFHGEGL